MPNPTSDIARMTAEELKTHFARGETLVILDVREPVERAFCAIPTPPTARDLHVPMGELPARLEEVKATKGESPSGRLLPPGSAIQAGRGLVGATRAGGTGQP